VTPIDPSKFLAELTGVDWGPVPNDAPILIRQRHELRRKPVGELRDEELKVFFRCGSDYDVIIPVAIERLKGDPELLGLLCSVLRIDSFPWRSHFQYVHLLRDIAFSASNQIVQITDDLERCRSEAALWHCYAEFERMLSSVPVSNNAVE
jgi:hypothetical protein